MNKNKLINAIKKIKSITLALLNQKTEEAVLTMKDGKVKRLFFKNKVISREEDIK